MKRIDLVAGARPNFMKVASLLRAVEAARDAGARLTYRLVHTGQHYDDAMSGSFFAQLGIPAPHVNLGAGGGTQAEQTAAIMVGYERLLLSDPADLTVVVGDVTSTLACSVVARKVGIPVAHVEAGIRSGDWTMPEEINRVVTDAVSNYFFTTSESAGVNLQASGIGADRVFFVGNTMIDTLLANRARFRAPDAFGDNKLRAGQYLVLTLHRPSNVDDPARLQALLEAIARGSHDDPIVFPVHPRTARTLSTLSVPERILAIPPQPYLEFNYLVAHARGVVTDSGGITEEATVLQVPCMTLRDSTERPETVTMGTNELLGRDPAALAPALARLFAGAWKRGVSPPLWDGRAGERVVEILVRLLDAAAVPATEARHG